MHAGGVDDFGAVRLDVGADGGDLVALDQDVAGREIGDIAIHRDDGAALEEGAAFVLRAHGRILPDAISAGSAARPLSLMARLELSAVMSDVDD